MVEFIVESFPFTKLLALFLRKLYHYNRWLFLLFIAFALGQLFINIKRGLTATPFFHYGMYSGFFNLPKDIEVWEVEVNRQKIELIDFQAKNADHIIEPLKFYSQLKNTNGLYGSHIRRFLGPLNILNNGTSYISNVTREGFISWYKDHLSKIIKKPINELRVYKNLYSVNHSSLYINDSLLFLNAAY